MRLKSDNNQRLCSQDGQIWRPSMGAQEIPPYLQFLPSRQWHLRCVPPSRLPQLDWPALCCCVCSLATITLALTWVRVSQAGHECLFSQLYSPLWLSNVRAALLHTSSIANMLLLARMFLINSVCRIRTLLLGKLFFLLFELQKLDASDYPYANVGISSRPSPQIRPEQTRL